MNIHKIIYDNTRQLLNVEQKINIATIILFCYQKDAKLFAELLYCDDKKEFIHKLNNNFDFDFELKLDDVNVKNSFFDTIKAVKKIEDKDGFYRAVYDNDELALSTIEIVDSFIEKAQKLN